MFTAKELAEERVDAVTQAVELTSAVQKYRERSEKESVWIHPGRRAESPAFHSAFCAGILPHASHGRRESQVPE
jgi:hypothetical protein